MRYMMSLLLSIVVHAMVLGVLVVLPLLFFNVVHADELIAILIEPPSIPVALLPPAAPTVQHAASGSKPVRGEIKQIPDHIPEGIPPADASKEPIEISGIVRGIGNISESVPTGNALKHLLETARQPELPPIILPKRPTPIQVSGPIQEAKLINKVNPVYPELAIRAHVSGTVMLEAVIDEEGIVENLKILSGHPLLRDAAYSAVKQWKYLPTMIGGEPVPVIAVVTVIFRFR